MLIIKQATIEEADTVRDFYCDLIDSMRDIEYKPAWKMGIYPTEQILRDAIKEKTLFMAVMDDHLVGTMILNHNCAREYENVEWRIKAEKEDIIIIHALAVSLSFQRKGIARQMVSGAIDICKKQSVRAIRLDVLHTNLPAEKLYLSMGFQYIDTLKLFYEDTGLTDFKLFELVLQEH